MFRLDGIGEDMEIAGFIVTDNLFEGGPEAMSGFGIILGQEMGPWRGRDIPIAGNAVGYTLWEWLVIDDCVSVDGLTVRDNIRFNTGGEYRLRSADGVGGVFSGNEEADEGQWDARRETVISGLDAARTR